MRSLFFFQKSSRLIDLTIKSAVSQETALLKFFEAKALCLSDRLYIDVFTSFLAYSEYHCAVDKSVNSVVFAQTDVFAGVVLCATLTFDDVACLGELAAEELQTETFAF